MFPAFVLDFLTLADGTNRLSQNITNYHSTLCKISEEQQRHLYCGRSLKTWQLKDGWEVQYTQERRQVDIKFEKKNLKENITLKTAGHAQG